MCVALLVCWKSAIMKAISCSTISGHLEKQIRLTPSLLLIINDWVWLVELAGHPRHNCDWFILHPMLLFPFTKRDIWSRRLVLRKTVHTLSLVLILVMMTDDLRRISSSFHLLDVRVNQNCKYMHCVNNSHTCNMSNMFQSCIFWLVHFVFMFSFQAFLPDFASLHAFRFSILLLVESILLMYIRSTWWHFFFFLFFPPQSSGTVSPNVLASDLCQMTGGGRQRLK